jgi:hypothetical protein
MTHLVGWECPALTEQLVPLRGGFIECIHHEMQICRQSSHAGDLSLAGTLANVKEYVRPRTTARRNALPNSSARRGLT